MSDMLANVLAPDTWKSLGREWLGHIHSIDKFPGKTLSQVLRHTWSSSMEAKDPRDKISGVLGLDRAQHGKLARLVPVYSLSFQSMTIGMSAYMFFIQDSYEILYHAAGLNAQPPRPSWVPDWKQDWTPDDWSGHLYYPKCKAFHEPTDRCVHKIRPDATPLVVLFPQVPEYYFEHLWCFASGVKETWKFDASVNPDTGALSLKLFHIKPFQSPPELIPSESSDYNVYRFYKNKYQLEISTPSTDLENMEAGPNHLFILLLNDLSQCLLFFLQETNSEDCFRLIRCCPCYDLRLVHERLRPERKIGSRHAGIWRNLYVTLERFCSYWNKVSMKYNCDEGVLTELIGGHQLLDIVLEIYQSRLTYWPSEDRPTYARVAAGQLIEGFKKNNLPNCIRLDEEVVVFRASPDQWDLFREAPIRNDLLSLSNDWYATYEWSKCVDGPWKYCCYWVPHDDFIYIQYSIKRLIWRFLRPFAYFRGLTQYRRATGETEREMVLRGPKPEDRSVYAPKWPHDSAAKLDLDGYFQEVKII